MNDEIDSNISNKVVDINEDIDETQSIASSIDDILLQRKIFIDYLIILMIKHHYFLILVIFFLQKETMNQF